MCPTKVEEAYGRQFFKNLQRSLEMGLLLTESVARVFEKEGDSGCLAAKGERLNDNKKGRRMELYQQTRMVCIFKCVPTVMCGDKCCTSLNDYVVFFGIQWLEN